MEWTFGRNSRLSIGLTRNLLELVSYVQANQIKYSEINQQVTSFPSQTGSHLRDALLGRTVGSRHGSLGLRGLCMIVTYGYVLCTVWRYPGGPWTVAPTMAHWLALLDKLASWTESKTLYPRWACMTHVRRPATWWVEKDNLVEPKAVKERPQFALALVF